MKRSRSPPQASSPRKSSRTKKKKPIQLLLHSVDSVIPYMTPMLLELHFPAPQPYLLVGVAIKDTGLAPIFADENSSKPKKYDFVSKFKADTYMEKYKHVLVPFFDLIKDGKNYDKNRGSEKIQASDQGVGVWNNQGRNMLSNESYISLTSNNKLDSTPIVSLYDPGEKSDCDVERKSTLKQKRRIEQRREKRIKQMNERNQRWLLELMSSNAKYIWKPIGFFDDSEANENEEHISNDKINGYAIVGWENFQHPQKIISTLDSSKTIAALSVNSIQSILNCIKFGVDVIGTDLITRWSKRGQAFCLEWNTYSSTNIRREETLKSCILDLTDKVYSKDGSALIENCTCMTCQHHTRAYIHHLICANELLAQILLMGHNLHHFLKFCQAATQARWKDYDGSNQGQHLEAFVNSCSQNNVLGNNR